MEGSATRWHCRYGSAGKARPRRSAEGEARGLVGVLGSLGVEQQQVRLGPPAEGSDQTRLGEGWPDGRLYARAWTDAQQSRLLTRPLE